MTSAESAIKMVNQEANQRWEHSSEIVRMELAVSPYLRYSIQKDSSKMVSLTQQFEFSAAHRLHCDQLSAEENEATFGKCNNPNGHGHNYVVEVTVRNQATENQVLPLSQLEALVKAEVIDRLDHKHLNEDLDCFKETIPSVENISIAIWNWLNEKIATQTPAQLDAVRVFETPKTWAEYRG